MIVSLCDKNTNVWTQLVELVDGVVADKAQRSGSPSTPSPFGRHVEGGSRCSSSLYVGHFRISQTV